MNAQEIKELIKSNIDYQDHNIDNWRKRIKAGSTDNEPHHILMHANALELTQEYRQAYVDLLIQIERVEEEE